MSTKRERRDAADVIRQVVEKVEDMPSAAGAYLLGYADGLIEARPTDDHTTGPASGRGTGEPSQTRGSQRWATTDDNS